MSSSPRRARLLLVRLVPFAALAAGVTACAAVLGIPGDVSIADDAGGLPGVDGSEPVLDGDVPEAAREAEAAVDAGEEAEAAVVDAGSDADECPPVVACDPAAPFGTPVLVPGASTPFAEGTARLSEDERTIVLCSSRNIASFDVFTATRRCVGDAFGAAVPFSELNTTTHHEYGATFTDDGTKVFFERQVIAPGGGNSDILVAVRGSDAGPFGTPTPVPGVNDVRPSNYDSLPFLRGDGSMFYFVGYDHPSTDIYTATFRLGGDFAGRYETQKLPGPVNSTVFDEHEVVLSRDQLHLYFSRSRRVPREPMDVWESHRASTAVDFPEPTVVEGVSTPEYSEAPVWLSADGCRLYLWSDRVGGAGSQDVWVATRPPPAAPPP